MRDHVSLVLSDDLVAGILELRDSLVEGVSRIDDQLLHHPHITVASIDNHYDGTILSSVEQFASNQDAIPLDFSVVSVFVRRGFVLSPKPSLELLELHSNLQHAIDMDNHIPEFLRPGNWVPHVTLVSPYTEKDHDFILRCLADIFQPISGFAVGLYVDHHEAEGEYGEDVRRFPFRDA